MRSCLLLAVAALGALPIVIAPAPARAAMLVTFGTTWDAPAATLQSIVDARYGAGRINVQTDYMGRTGITPDPFYWIDDHFPALLVTEVAGFRNTNTLGWYEETFSGALPVIDGVNDGVVFDGPSGQGATAVIVFGRPLYRFGFYLDPNGAGASNYAPIGERFFTNRTLNDQGPSGAGALHAPSGGDAQAIVFDVSRWTEPNTWLVCFEDTDAGSNPGPCCGTTDDDYNDMVFEITALSTTPAVGMSFGELKRRYR